MNLYAYETGNRHGQYLIFTSKAAALAWARAATRLTDPEILANLRKITASGNYYNLFTVKKKINKPGPGNVSPGFLFSAAPMLPGSITPAVRPPGARRDYYISFRRYTLPV